MSNIDVQLIISKNGRSLTLNNKDIEKLLNTISDLKNLLPGDDNVCPMNKDFTYSSIGYVDYGRPDKLN